MVVKLELILIRALLVLCMYGYATIYLMLRKNGNEVMFIISLILFIHVIADVFINNKSVLLYDVNFIECKKIVLNIAILLMCNYLISFIVKKRFKRISI